MSIRAYKIEKIVTKERPTFTHHDNAIYELLSDWGCFESLDTSGGGVIDVPKSAIKEELSDKTAQSVHKLEADDIEILEQMLLDCGDSDYVQYYLY